MSNRFVVAPCLAAGDEPVSVEVLSNVFQICRKPIKLGRLLQVASLPEQIRPNADAGRIERLHPLRALQQTPGFGERTRIVLKSSREFNQ